MKNLSTVLILAITVLAPAAHAAKGNRVCVDSRFGYGARSTACTFDRNNEIISCVNYSETGCTGATMVDSGKKSG